MLLVVLRFFCALWAANLIAVAIGALGDGEPFQAIGLLLIAAYLAKISIWPGHGSRP